MDARTTTGSMIEIDIEGLDELIQKLEKASGGELQKQIEVWLEATGITFLDIVQDEIIQQEIVDTRGLVSSFRKGDSKNFWKLKSGGITLTLEVGTKLEYASYVNDGYPLVTERSASGAKRIGGQLIMTRWVPGVWKGDSFEYIKGAKTGMLLKEQFIPGRPYFEDAEAIMQLFFNTSLERKLQQWIDAYFN